MISRRQCLRAAALLTVVALAGCTTSPPRRPGNACKIFAEKSSWRRHTRRAAKKWKADPAVLLAIMKKESSFRADARPPRKTFLGIPLWRPSSAYGYAQALDETWALYRKQTRSFFAQRDSFKDAMDFIGWYTSVSRRRLKFKKHDAYRHYLAYHQGWGGYARGTYKNNKWLKGAARKVRDQAARYRAQIKKCGL